MKHTITLDDEQLHALRFGLRYTMSAERPSIVALLDVIDRQVREGHLQALAEQTRYAEPEQAEVALLHALHTRSGTALIAWVVDGMTEEQKVAVLGDLRLLVWEVARATDDPHAPLVLDPRVVGVSSVIWRDDDDDETAALEVHTATADGMRLFTYTDLGYVERPPGQ